MQFGIPSRRFRWHMPFSSALENLCLSRNTSTTSREGGSHQSTNYLKRTNYSLRHRRVRDPGRVTTITAILVRFMFVLFLSVCVKGLTIICFILAVSSKASSTLDHQCSSPSHGQVNLLSAWRAGRLIKHIHVFMFSSILLWLLLVVRIYRFCNLNVIRKKLGRPDKFSGRSSCSTRRFRSRQISSRNPESKGRSGSSSNRFCCSKNRFSRSMIFFVSSKMWRQRTIRAWNPRVPVPMRQRTTWKVCRATLYQNFLVCITALFLSFATEKTVKTFT